MESPRKDFYPKKDLDSTQELPILPDPSELDETRELPTIDPDATGEFPFNLDEYRKSFHEIASIATEGREAEKAELTDSSRPEGTRAELVGKLKGKIAELIGGVAEKAVGLYDTSKEYLAERGSELQEKYVALRNIDFDEKIKALGKATGENLLKTGEWYRKLPLKYKIAVSGALIGASVATGGASTFVTLLSAAKLGQRSLASLGTYTAVEGLVEKRIAKREEESGTARTKWQTWKKHGLATGAALAIFSGLPGHALKEGFEAAGGGHALEWLGNVMGHPSPHPVAFEPPPVEAAAIAGAAGEASFAPEVSEMPSVDIQATQGDSYEKMLKDVWKLHLDPSKYPEGSDIHNLIVADKDSLGAVAHRIALNPGHGFNPDGTSVIIHPGAQMTIGADGQIKVSDSIRGVQAPEGAPVTHLHHASEAPAHTDSPAPAPEATAPVDAQTPDTTHSADVPTQDAATTPEASPAPTVEASAVDHEIITNHFGVKVALGEPHIYSDAKGTHLFAYGGQQENPRKFQEFVESYLKSNPKSTVYALGTDQHGDYRLPVKMVGGEPNWGSEKPTYINGFKKIFNPWLRIKGPEDFRKIIQ